MLAGVSQAIATLSQVSREGDKSQGEWHWTRRPLIYMYAMSLYSFPVGASSLWNHKGPSCDITKPALLHQKIPMPSFYILAVRIRKWMLLINNSEERFFFKKTEIWCLQMVRQPLKKSETPPPQEISPAMGKWAIPSHTLCNICKISLAWNLAHTHTQ